MGAPGMKKLLALLLALPTLAIPAAYDPIMMQRNATDTGANTRLLPWTAVPSLYSFDPVSMQPQLVTLGSGLAITSGVLDTAGGGAVTWSTLTGRPAWTGVFDGSYSSLTGKPTLFDGTWASLMGKPSFATVATTGAYSDLSGTPSIPAAQVNSDWNAVSGVAQILNKPTIPAAFSPSQSSASRSLNTAFQVSSTRHALVSYSVQITVTASIGGGQNGDVILEIASDSGFTTNVQTVAIAGNGQTYTLAVAIQGVQPTTNNLTGFVPAGYYTRLRTVNNTGTPSFSYRAGQEILL